MKLSDKINELYKDKQYDRENSLAAIPQTLTLLTSGGWNSAFCYTGTSPRYRTVDCALVLKPNINKNVYAVIYVSWSDLYVIDLVHIGSKAEIISHNPDIYIDSLKEMYEYLYDEYVKENQGGIIRI